MSGLLFLVPAFFVTALLYASVGFGGGSTYNALLVLAGTDFRILPAIALVCNLVVVSGGTWRFARAGHLHLERITPWLVTSIPAAWIGGRLPVSETLFIGLLGFSLLAAGLRMILPGPGVTERPGSAGRYQLIALVGGALLGLLAGMVGIGGGIFLSPLLYLLGRDHPRAIAATCSVFILANSLAGLAGQVMKLEDSSYLGHALAYWPVVPAVLVGGQIGSWMGSRRLNPLILRRLTAVLVLYVAARLVWRWLTMITGG